MKKLKRKCLACGDQINIQICEKGRYQNGHFFGKFNLPIGKGEYKKIKSTKIGKNNIDVVKWTGKEKKIEYWECNNCFEQAAHECWLEETLRKLYGEKCKDYEKGCACCQAWNVYETIIDANRGKL